MSKERGKLVKFYPDSDNSIPGESKTSSLLTYLAYHDNLDILKLLLENANDIEDINFILVVSFISENEFNHFKTMKKSIREIDYYYRIAGIKATSYI
jgi:hypothetical protein